MKERVGGCKTDKLLAPKKGGGVNRGFMVVKVARCFAELYEHAGIKKYNRNC